MIIQPTSRTCGQAVVAMVTGATVDEVISLIGDARTHARDLRKAMHCLGWTMAARHCAKLPDRPTFPAIVWAERIKQHRMMRHWLYWDGGLFIDPANGAPCELGEDTAGRFYLVHQTAAPPRLATHSGTCKD